jgi:transposase
LRELQAVTGSAPEGEWCWATQATDALTAKQAVVSEAIAQGRDAVDPAALAPQMHRYRSAVLLGARQTAACGGKLMRKHHALARRLLNRQDDYLRFTADWRIPADNNGSERDIRMAKLKQKVSGCLRTLAGAQQFCAIRSYLSTAAKHDLHFFATLVMLTEGQPWMPTAM